jgi:hypothetical protein
VGEKYVGAAGRCQKVVEANGIRCIILEPTNEIRFKLARGHLYTTDYEMGAFTQWPELYESSIPGWFVLGILIESRSI